MASRALEVWGTENIDVNNFAFVVTYLYDSDTPAPWQNGDGHGPVRMVRWRKEKRPGERPMHNTGGDLWLYDWQAACKMAREEKWGPGKPHEAVQREFKYFQEWCAQDWMYVGVSVELALFPEYESCVWGVETYNRYHEEFAKDLALEVLDNYLDDIQKGVLKNEL